MAAKLHSVSKFWFLSGPADRSVSKAVPEWLAEGALAIFLFSQRAICLPLGQENNG